VPLGEAAPCTSCRIVPMLNLASDNHAHLTQLTLQPNFPLTPLVRTEARKKFFSQKKSKPTQNRSWILKRNLKDHLLNFKDPFVLKLI
jgi:hypothetical protein